METCNVVSQDVFSFSGCKRLASAYEVLKAAIADRHLPTAEHSIRVRVCATSLGLAWGLSSRELTTLTLAAEIHDIGKLFVPIGILDKREKLSNADWAVIRNHPSWGAKIATSAFPTIPEVAQCVLCHHERIDGSGYPNGLRGSQIDLLARVISVADAFVALTEDRAFRRSLSTKEALKILSEDDKDKYDQRVVKMLTNLSLSNNGEHLPEGQAEIFKNLVASD